MDISHRSEVLCQASIQRINECHRAFDSRDHVLASYLSGVAVECILQGLAIKDGAEHDARHDLGRWLAKCPEALRQAVSGDSAPEWSYLFSMWDNSLRYHSDSGFLGYIREKRANRGIKGDPVDVIREVARRLRHSATIIHAKGLVQWKTPTAQ